MMEMDQPDVQTIQDELDSVIAAAAKTEKQAEKVRRDIQRKRAKLEEKLAGVVAEAERIRQEEAERVIGDRLDNHNHRMRQLWSLCKKYNATVDDLNQLGTEIWGLHARRHEVKPSQAGGRELLKSPIASIERGPGELRGIPLNAAELERIDV